MLNACRALNMSCDDIIHEFLTDGIEISEILIRDHSSQRLDPTLVRREWTSINKIPIQFRTKLPVLQQQDPNTLIVWIPTLNSRF